MLCSCDCGPGQQQAMSFVRNFTANRTWPLLSLIWRSLVQLGCLGILCLMRLGMSMLVFLVFGPIHLDNNPRLHCFFTFCQHRTFTVPEWVCILCVEAQQSALVVSVSTQSVSALSQLLCSAQAIKNERLLGGDLSLMLCTSGLCNSGTYSSEPRHCTAFSLTAVYRIS